MELFVDTCNNNLVLILFKGTKAIDKVVLNNQTRISDIFNENLENLLNNNQVKLKELEGIYITKGPGSYTGVRIGLTMGKTLFSLDSKMKIYTISSLLFQAGREQVVSILDARSQKSYFGVYDNGEPIIEDQLLPNDVAEQIGSGFENYKTVVDQKGIDYEKNLFALKDKFVKVSKSEQLNPNYIKNFI